MFQCALAFIFKQVLEIFESVTTSIALLLFIQELAFPGCFTVALTEISGKNHIGSHITTTSIKKRITVAFNNCYAEKPIKVQVVVTGSPILPDTFRSLLVDTFPWGFVSYYSFSLGFPMLPTKPSILGVDIKEHVPSIYQSVLKILKSKDENGNF